MINSHNSHIEISEGESERARKGDKMWELIVCYSIKWATFLMYALATHKFFFVTKWNDRQ